MDVTKVSDFIIENCFHFAHFLVEDELQASQLAIDVLQSFVIETPHALERVESSSIRNEFLSRVYQISKVRRNHFKIDKHLDLSGRAAFFLVYEYRLSTEVVSKILKIPKEQVLLKVVEVRQELLKERNMNQDKRAGI